MATKKKTTKKKATAKKTVEKKTVKKTVKAKVTTKKTATKKSTRKTAIKKAAKRIAAVKKKTSKKSSPIENRPKVETWLTDEELVYFQLKLLLKSAEIKGDVSQMEEIALKTSRSESSGDLSAMPIHMADIGTDNFEQEFSLGLLDSERKVLREIGMALERIEERTYGICLGTDKPIKKARLEAKPWARYCIEYATMVEKGLLVEGERFVEDDDDGDGFADFPFYGEGYDDPSESFDVNSIEPDDD